MAIHPTNDAYVSVGFASFLRINLIPLGNIRERVDDISKQFTGAGWKNLPQELVDEILSYLLDDLAALKACSLTCKHLFGATRPTLHQRLRLVSWPPDVKLPKPKGSLFSPRRGDTGAFERLVDADRLGLLGYIRHITFEMGNGSFNLENMRKYHPCTSGQ